MIWRQLPNSCYSVHAVFLASHVLCTCLALFKPATQTYDAAQGAPAAKKGPTVVARPDAAIPGLAVQDTRDRAKQLNDDLMAEASSKRGAGPGTNGHLPPPPSQNGSSHRDHDR